MLRLPYHNRYAYSPIVERKDYAWPDGKRLAVYLGLNIEHFAFGAGDGHLLTVAGTPPDPRTFAWRDYGNRVGVWRCLDLFDELNLPAAHLINTTVFDYAPQIVAALKARGDEFIGHGRTNAERHGQMWESDEKRFLEEVRDAIEKASGKRPRGWMAPWMSSSHHTPEQFRDFIIGQFEELLRQSAKQPLVCGIALHTMVVGQPYRLRMLREALQHIVGHPQKDKVWFTRPSAIYDHCAALPKGTMVPPPA